MRDLLEEPATKDRPATVEIAPLTIIGTSRLPARRRMAAVPSCTAPETLGDDIAAQGQSPGFGGCAFIKVASEFDDPDEPVRRAVAAHRAWFAEIVRTAFADAGHVRPNDPTRHFIMLRDGAMVAGYLDGSEQAAETFTRGVAGLLRYINAAP